MIMVPVDTSALKEELAGGAATAAATSKLVEVRVKYLALVSKLGLTGIKNVPLKIISISHLATSLGGEPFVFDIH